MKRILIAALMIGLAGGAYAAGFNDLAGLNAAGMKALAEGNEVPVVSKKSYTRIPMDDARNIYFQLKRGGKAVLQDYANGHPAFQAYGGHYTEVTLGEVFEDMAEVIYANGTSAVKPITHLYTEVDSYHGLSRGEIVVVVQNWYGLSVTVERVFEGVVKLRMGNGDTLIKSVSTVFPEVASYGGISKGDEVLVLDYWGGYRVVTVVRVFTNGMYEVVLPGGETDVVNSVNS